MKSMSLSAMTLRMDITRSITFEICQATGSLSKYLCCAYFWRGSFVKT